MRLLGIALLVCLIFIAPAIAQDDCPAIAQSTIEATQIACQTITTGQACLSSGEMVDIEEIDAIETIPFVLVDDDESDPSTWGTAIMHLESDNEQPIKILLVGGTQLINAPEIESSLTEPTGFQSIYLVTTNPSNGCETMPNAAIIQNFSDEAVVVVVNGIEMELTSATIAITATEVRGMEITVLSGQMTTTFFGQSRTVEAGQSTQVQLGLDDNNNLTAFNLPTSPRGLNMQDSQYLPIHILGQSIAVPSRAGLIDTGVFLTPRQTFFVSAFGIANLCGSDDAACAADPELNRWIGPSGNLELGTCQGDDGDCPLMPGRYGALVAQIGDEGDPFLIGAGGTFVANAEGSLRLAFNDYGYEDNLGVYHALITLDGETVFGDPELLQASLPFCSLTAISTANLRSGPGVDYRLVETLAANNSLLGQGQFQATDGFTWWLLENDAWIREDLAREEGECDALPTVEVSS